MTALAQPGNPRPRLFRLPARRGRREPDGLQQRRGRGGREATGGAVTAAGASRPAEPRERQLGRPALGRFRCSASTSASPRSSPRTTRKPCWPTTPPARVCSRRTPTTWWSTCPRRTRPGLRSLQAVDRLGPLLDEVRRVADDAALGPVPAVREDRPRPGGRRRHRRRRDGARPGDRGTDRHQHHDLARRPAHAGCRGGGGGAGGLSGPVLRRRSLEVLRLLRHHDREITIISVGGVTDERDVRPASPGRGDARAGLHRLRLRRPAVAEPGRPRADRMTASEDGHAPVHVTAELLAAKTVGAYHHLSLVGPRRRRAVAPRQLPGGVRR